MMTPPEPLTLAALGPSGVLGSLQAFLGDQPQESRRWFDLGVALSAEGRHEEAAAALASALQLSPHNIGIECACAVALSAQGAHHEAGDLLEELIQRNPGAGWAYFHLAGVRSRQGAFADAAALWDCAARLLDDPLDSLEHLAMTLLRLRDHAGAQTAWQRMLKLDPHHPIALHMRSAASEEPPPSRASAAYITRLFNCFAPDFDRILDKLDYTVPRALKPWMTTHFGPPTPTLAILDAGCGTGLCGQHLRPWARALTGVDLSPAMLALARRRALYDHLEEAELVQFLDAHLAAFDAIIAGDVLCYFGDLSTVLPAAIAALRPGGRLGFSVEASPDADAYRLCSHGRYAHARAYLERLISPLATFDIAPTIARLELAQPVHSYWVSALRK